MELDVTVNNECNFLIKCLPALNLDVGAKVSFI